MAGLLIPASGGGNVRYNEQTDYLEILINGAWRNWKLCGFKNLYLFKNNNTCDDVTLGYETSKNSPIISDYPSDGNYSAVTYDETIYMKAMGADLRCATVNKTIDLSGFNKCKISFKWAKNRTSTAQYCQFLIKSGESIVAQSEKIIAAVDGGQAIIDLSGKENSLTSAYFEAVNYAKRIGEGGNEYCHLYINEIQLYSE